jgi:hypothetical protein
MTKILGADVNKKLIFFFALIYTIVFILFYPSFYASTDEHEYLYNAYLLRSGSLLVEDKTLTPFGLFNGEGYISVYYIGKSIFLIPFTLLGWRAVFISGLFIHIINVYLFYAILRRFKFDTKATILFLFYPALIWNSRTLGNESLTLTFVLAAFYFYTLKGKIKYVLSGFMFGIACIVRYETLLAFLSFAAVALFRDRNKLFYLVLGFLPVASFILLFNNTYYGGWLGTGYTLVSSIATVAGKKTLAGLMKYLLYGGSNLDVNNFVTYILMLSLVYPLMIVAPFLYNKYGKREISLALVVYLLFYSHFTGVSTYPILSPVTLTAHLRYHIPVIGLLLFTYVPFYKDALKRLGIPERPMFWLAVVLLVSGSIYGSYMHDRFLDDRRTVFEQIYSNTEDGALLLGTVDDGMYVMPGVFGDRRYLGIDRYEIHGIEDVEPYMNNNIYVIYLRYKTQMKEHPRAKRIERARELAKSFVYEHSNSLDLVFNTTKPHYLEIYRFNR